MAALLWGAATDAGRVRDENEDAYVAEAMVFVVADGMGGHQAGEVASALAATTLRDRLVAGATSADVVVAAVVEANAAIFQTAHVNTAQRGMGTTLTAMAVLPQHDGHPEQLAIVNVGDSRTYLVRSGELTRATVDHSYVQELLATGHITEAEARAHPRRNIVTRALGIEPTVRVDSWVMPVVRGDRFVLCSDGLVDEVDDDEIHSIIAAHAQPQECADALVAAAVANGGRDNVTVIVVDVLDGVIPDGSSGMPTQADDDDDDLTRRLPLPDDEPTAEVPVIAESRVKQQLSRRLSAGTFLLMLIAAVIITALITLIAVAITNGNDDEQPTPTTTTITTTVTTVAVTTTAPRSTSISSVPTTVARSSTPGTTITTP